MKNINRGSFLGLLVILCLLAVSYNAFGQACCPDDSSTIGASTYHEVVFFQGDNPNTEEVEPRDVIWVLDRSRWTVPWNGTVLHTYVPENARNITIDHVEMFELVTGSTFLSGRYSWDNNPNNPPLSGWSSGPIDEGMYFWRFPDGVDRNTTAGTSVNSTTDYEDFMDATLTNASHWQITDGNMSLELGVESANYTSELSVFGVSVSSINITWEGVDIDSISVFATNDNGTTWVEVSNGTETVFGTEGNSLRWRVSMEQNITLNDTSVLDQINVNFRFIPDTLDIWLQTTYSLDITEDAQTVDLEYPFDASSSSLVFLGYFDPDFEMEAIGMDVTSSEQQDYPGKMVYLHMMGAYSDSIQIVVNEGGNTGESGISSETLLYAALGIAFIVLSLAIYFRTRDTDAGELGDEIEGDKAEVEAAPSETAIPEGDIDSILKSIEGLEEQKNKVLSSIKRVDNELAEGIITQEDHDNFVSGYKKRAAEILREIDGLKRA